MESKRLVMFSVGIIIFVLSLVVVRPNLSKTLQLKKNIDQDKAKLMAISDKAEKLTSFDNQEIQKRVNLLEEILPSDKPVMNLIASLQQLCQEQDLVFSGIDLKPGIVGQKESKTKTNATNAQNFTISFSVEGSLPKISYFITNLEKTPPLMTIEEINLSIISQTESEILTKVSLTVKVYYQDLPEMIAAVDAPLPVFTQAETDVLSKLNTFKTIPKVPANAPTGKANPFTLP